MNRIEENKLRGKTTSLLKNQGREKQRGCPTKEEEYKEVCHDPNSLNIMNDKLPRAKNEPSQALECSSSARKQLHQLELERLGLGSNKISQARARLSLA